MNGPWRVNTRHLCPAQLSVKLWGRGSAGNQSTTTHSIRMRCDLRHGRDIPFVGRANLLVDVG